MNIVTFSQDGKQFRVKVGGQVKLEPKGAKFLEDTSELGDLIIDSVDLIEDEKGKLITGKDLEGYKLTLKPVKKQRSDKIETIKFKKRKRYRRFLTSRRDYVIYEVAELKKS